MCLSRSGNISGGTSGVFQGQMRQRNEAQCRQRKHMHFSKVAEASTKGLPWFPRYSVSFSEVRQASRGADLDLGILEVAHERPREFSRCDGIFWIRPGDDKC